MQYQSHALFLQDVSIRTNKILPPICCFKFLLFSPPNSLSYFLYFYGNFSEKLEAIASLCPILNNREHINEITVETGISTCTIIHTEHKCLSIISFYELCKYKRPDILFENITNTNHSSLDLKSKKDFVSNSCVRELDAFPGNK